MRKKRILTTLAIACSMVVAMIPAGPAAEAGGEDASESEKVIEELIHPGKPDWYKDQDDSNPYGYKAGVPFRLYEDAELFTYLSDPESSFQQAKIFELYQKDDGSGFLEDGSWKEVDTLDLSDASYKDSTINSHWFVTAVPFDLGYNKDEDGNTTPRKTCMAFMGAKKNGDAMDVDLWVYDTKCKKYSDVLTLGQITGLKGDMYTDDETLMYQVESLLTLTAGDYDDDRKDTLVAYAAFSDGPGLVEIDVEGDGTAAPRLTKGAVSTKMLHPKYMEKLSEFLKTSYIDQHEKLGCSLASGDVNGDKIDDLVVVSHTQILNDGKPSEYGDEIIMPALAVSPGGSGVTGEKLVDGGSIDTVYVGTDRVDSPDFPNSTQRDSAALPTAAIARTGLADGNQIVVCGYDEMILRAKSDQQLEEVERDGDGARLFIYDYTKETPECIRTNEDPLEFAQALRKGDITSSHDGATFSRIPFAAVRLDGRAATDRLFIGGTFWEIEDQGFKSEYTVPCLDRKYAVEDFEEDSDGLKLEDVYLDTLSVQSLTKVGGDYESLAFTLVAVIHDDEPMLGSPYSYYYRVGVAGPGVDPNTSRITGKFGTSFDQLYRFHNLDNPELSALNAVQFDLTGGDLPAPCAVLCPVDSVDDGLTVRYNSKDITFADPQILAILQASPYFGVLDQEGAKTSYEFNCEFSRSDEDSHTTSIGVGFTAGVTTPMADVSFKVGYSGEMRKWSEHEYSTSCTVGFDADHDSVIVYRTPVVYYTYDVWNPEKGEWAEQGLGISYANTASYQQLSIQDYNAFVEKYNAEGERRAEEAGSTEPFPKLNPIGEGLYLGCEGDPAKYYRGGQAPEGYTVIDDHEHTIGYNGGEDFTELETGESVTTGSERQDGVNFDFDVKFGSEFVKAGGYFSLEDLSGHATTTVDTTKTGVKHAVSNLDEGKLLAAGYTDEQIRAFSFSWVPAKWDSGVEYTYTDTEGKTFSRKTPVYGYGLTMVQYPLNLSEAELTVGPTEFEYDGTEKKPSVSVTLQGQEPDPKDYTVSFLYDGKPVEKCIDPGTYTVVVKGAGPNIGKKEAEFTIKKKAEPVSIKGAKVVLSADTFVYNAGTQKPVIRTIGGMKLKEGTDYTVIRPAASVDAGTYSLLITGKGGYTGTTKAEYKIRAKAISPTVTLKPASAAFTGRIQKPQVVVKNGSGTLKAGRDYLVTYAAGRKDPGKYVITVKLKGNYSGNAARTFTITKAANPLKVKAKKVTLTAAALEKKNLTLAVSRGITFTKKGKGTMTHKLAGVTKAAAKKYFKVSPKTGRITVKQGLKKGTYKLKIKMKAAGNKYYKASAAMTVTVQITVK